MVAPSLLLLDGGEAQPFFLLSSKIPIRSLATHADLCHSHVSISPHFVLGLPSAEIEFPLDRGSAER